MFDFATMKSTGCGPVDLCANYIAYYRKLQMPVKSLSLHPKLYGQFKLWVEKNAGTEATETKKFEMDSVHIDEGSRFQTKPIIITFWKRE